MSLLTIERIQLGEVGVKPGSVKMVTTADLTTVTTAGYLNNFGTASTVNLAPSDIIECFYSYNVNTDIGILAWLQPSFSNGVITLNVCPNQTDVLFPVVSGDFAVFNGSAGQIKDSGAAPSAASQAYVVMSPGSLTSGNIPFLNDVNGTLNAGRAPSASTAGYKVVMSPGTLTSGNIPFLNDANGTLNDGRTPSATTAGYKVVMSPGSLTIGNLAKIADANGTLADQGFAMKSVAGAVAAGGAADQSFTDAFCTSGSNVIGNWATQTNPANVIKIVAGNGSFVVTSSVDAGAGTFNYIITK